MTTYLIRRFIQMLVSLLLGSFIAYAIILYIPGGGLKDLYSAAKDYPQYNNGIMPASVQQHMTELSDEFKVDKPLIIGYFLWLFDPNVTTERNENLVTVPRGIDLQIGGLHIQGSGALTGNFGFSEYQNGIGDTMGSRKYVVNVIGERWVNTALLIALSFPVAVLFALIIGVIGAVRQGSKLDSALTIFSFAGLSIPSFALGLILIIFFAVVPRQLHNQLGWSWFPYLPVGDVADSISNNDWLNHTYHALLPAATLALAQIAWLSRNVRFSMVEVLRQEYIRTARAKGVPRRGVILKHALRNSMLPLITLIGLALPGLVTGAIVVEQVFNYNGMGQLFFRSIGGCLSSGLDSVNKNCWAIGGPMDPSTLLLLLNILVLSVALSSMLADILYTVADPRINYASGRNGA